MNSSTTDKIKSLTEQISQLLPNDINDMKTDVKKNIRALLESSFKQMDLVTREEFDTQTAVLNKTRMLLEELKRKVEELESTK